MDFSLTSKEICDIVRACAKAGVKHFELNTLQISFYEPADAKRVLESKTPEQIDLPSDTETQLEFPGPDLATPPPQFSEGEYDYLLAVENPVAWEDQQLKDTDDAES